MGCTHIQFIYPNLGRGNFIPPPPPPHHHRPSCWFFLNNSETINPITLAFYNIYSYFIRDILVKSGISNLCQSPNVGQKSDGSVPNFRISSESSIKENCQNSRTIGDIDMKLVPVRNETTSKKFTMTSCCQIVTALTFFQFMVNLEQSGSRIPEP